MSLNFITEFVAKKTGIISEENDSLDTLAQNESSSVVKDGVKEQASAGGVNRFKNTPLGQLGNDFISEQIAKNGNQILNNATGLLEDGLTRITGVPIRKTIEDAQKLAFNAVSAAMTAKNDLMLYFLQQTAQEAINAILEKRQIIEEVRLRHRYLYNALVILVAGNPFFSQYLIRLRQALTFMVTANNRFVNIRNTFVATDIFVNAQFNIAIQELERAEDLLTPPDHNPDIKFTDSGLLANVGIPSEPQQLALLMSIPQLVQDFLLAMNGYFAVTLKLNALLLAFMTGLDALQSTSSKKLRDYSISMLDSLLNKLESLIGRMAIKINGDQQALLQPVPGFVPDSVGTSAESLRWVLELRSIIEFARFIPGKTLSDVNLSNDAVSRYHQAVAQIKAKGNRTQGDAVLTATEGREEIGQLEAQAQLFGVKALEAIIDANTPESVLALGRTVLARLDLSFAQDQEIELILRQFVNQQLPLFDSLRKTADGVFSTLENLGLDRAVDFLRQGKFEDFFNLNTKTATYAGAALVGIALLKECAETTEDQQHLVQAEREIQRENKSKELLAQRNATVGFEQQKAKNEQEVRRLQTVKERATRASEKCGVPDDFSPPNLLKNVGSIIGVSALSSNGSTSFLNKIGKGIL